MSDEEELKRWYEVRSVFLGLGNWKCHRRLALQMASECKHEQAVWLLDVCERVGSPFVLDDDSSGDEEYLQDAAKDIPLHAVLYFFEQITQTPGIPQEECARLMAWRGIMTHSYIGSKDSGNALLYDAAKLGDPLAMWHLGERGWFSNDTEHVEWGNKSAALGEPLGMFLAWRNSRLQLEYLRRAAELGHYGAQYAYGLRFQKSDMRYWHYLTLARMHSVTANELILSLRSEETTPVHAGALFQVGETFVASRKARFTMIGYGWGEKVEDEDVDDGSNISISERELITTFKRVVAYRDACCRDAKLAISAWTMVARRLKIVHDMRKFIGQRIWDLRTTWKDYVLNVWSV